MEYKQIFLLLFFIPVSILGQIASEKNIDNLFSSGEITFSSAIVFSNSKSSNISIASLDTNKFVIAWRDDLSGGKGFSMIGEITGDNISFGELEIFDPGVVGEIVVKKLEPQKFTICWRDNKQGGIGRAIVGEVNYNIISYADSYTFNDTITENISLTALDYYKCAISFSDGGDNFHGKSIKATVVGNYVLFSPKATFSGNQASEIKSCKLTDSTFAVVYFEIGNSLSEIVQGKVFSDSILFGTGVGFASETTNQIEVTRLFDNKFVLSYTSDGLAKTQAGTFFNGGFSFGLADSIGFSDPDELLVSPMDPNHFVSVSKFPDNSFQGTYLTINGTAQHKYNPTSISSGFSGLSISNLTDKKFIVAYADNSGGSNGKLIIGNIDKPGGYSLNAKAFLEGPFNGFNMDTSLNPQFLPSLQPYHENPWNYAGAEYLSNLPDNVVDWIFFELRETNGDASTATSDKIINRQAALLTKDGNLLSSDGLSKPYFESEINENLYLVIDHRNHLIIMSALPLNGFNGMYSYDFSNSIDKVYGDYLGYKYLSPGIFGMPAGDADANAQIQNEDKDDVWFFENGMTGYLPGDFNMDGTTDILDKDNYWFQNAGMGSQVPE